MKVVMLGEIRRIGIEVYSKSGNDFAIDSAEYDITRSDSAQTVISSGVPRIEDKKITMLFNASELGQYYVIFTFHIKDETLKAKVLVRVVK